MLMEKLFDTFDRVGNNAIAC